MCHNKDVTSSFPHITIGGGGGVQIRGNCKQARGHNLREGRSRKEGRSEGEDAQKPRPRKTKSLTQVLHLLISPEIISYFLIHPLIILLFLFLHLFFLIFLSVFVFFLTFLIVFTFSKRLHFSCISFQFYFIFSNIFLYLFLLFLLIFISFL